MDFDSTRVNSDVAIFAECDEIKEFILVVLVDKPIGIGGTLKVDMVSVEWDMFFRGWCIFADFASEYFLFRVVPATGGVNKKFTGTGIRDTSNSIRNAHSDIDKSFIEIHIFSDFKTIQGGRSAIIQLSIKNDTTGFILRDRQMTNT